MSTASPHETVVAAAHRAFERAYGNVVDAGDGLLHLDAGAGELTRCGRPIVAARIRWVPGSDVACGSCLIDAGVPLARGGWRP